MKTLLWLSPLAGGILTMFIVYGAPPWAAKMGACPVPVTAGPVSQTEADAPTAPVKDVSSVRSDPSGDSALPPEIAAADDSGLRRLEVEFDDIPCPGHIRTILDAMELVNGVGKVKVHYSDYRGTVEYDPSIVSPGEILAGMPHDCPARIVSDNPKG